MRIEMLGEHASKFQGEIERKVNEFKESYSHEQKKHAKYLTELKALHQDYMVYLNILLLFIDSLLRNHFFIVLDARRRTNKTGKKLI